jgi:hypothetical protein
MKGQKENVLMELGHTLLYVLVLVNARQSLDCPLPSGVVSEWQESVQSIVKVSDVIQATFYQRRQCFCSCHTEVATIRLS